MADHEKDQLTPEGEVSDASKPDRESGQEAAVMTDDELTKLLAAITEKNRIHDDLAERLKRLQADFDNFRRRTRQEKEELSAVVGEGMLLQLLPVLDNFERAIAASEQADSAALKSGIEMIYRQFFQTLERLGLAPLQAVGVQFDPQIHEAVMSVQDDAYSDGFVAEELQKGYAVRGKVIRPSMVKVVNNS